MPRSFPDHKSYTCAEDRPKSWISSETFFAEESQLITTWNFFGFTLCQFNLILNCRCECGAQKYLITCNLTSITQRPSPDIFYTCISPFEGYTFTQFILLYTTRPFVGRTRILSAHVPTFLSLLRIILDKLTLTSMGAGFFNISNDVSSIFWRFVEMKSGDLHL